MRKITLLILLLPLFANAQTEQLISKEKAVPDVLGMLGIPFGKTKQECIALMKQKGYLLEPEKTDYLSFHNVRYANWTETVATFYFSKGKFFHGIVIILPSEKAKALDEYDRLTSSLEEKYGSPNLVRDFKYPYKDGDGFERTALESGYATISDTWNDLGPGRVSATIDKSLIVIVSYSLTDEVKRLAEERKQQMLKDL